MPDETTLSAAVRAVRTGERSAFAGSAPEPAKVGRTSTVEVLATLRRSLEQGVTVWLGYVDHHGTTSERVVDPVRLEGGWLAAFDHRAGEVRSFAVHRITGVVPVGAG